MPFQGPSRVRRPAVGLPFAVERAGWQRGADHLGLLERGARVARVALQELHASELGEDARLGARVAGAPRERRG